MAFSRRSVTGSTFIGGAIGAGAGTGLSQLFSIDWLTGGSIGIILGIIAGFVSFAWMNREHTIYCLKTAWKNAELWEPDKKWWKNFWQPMLTINFAFLDIWLVLVAFVLLIGTLGGKSSAEIREIVHIFCWVYIGFFAIITYSATKWLHGDNIYVCNKSIWLASPLRVFLVAPLEGIGWLFQNWHKVDQFCRNAYHRTGVALINFCNLFVNQGVRIVVIGSALGSIGGLIWGSLVASSWQAAIFGGLVGCAAAKLMCFMSAHALKHYPVAVTVNEE